MVLIQGNGLSHALLGVKQKPFPGMTSLYFQEKGYYIVLKTTVQGWAPGFIDRRVFEALKSGYFQFLELNYAIPLPFQLRLSIWPLVLQ